MYEEFILKHDRAIVSLLAPMWCQVVTRSWCLEGDTVIEFWVKCIALHFQDHKQSAVQFNYTGEKAEISAADISNSHPNNLDKREIMCI